METAKKILIPCDFTVVTEFAFAHAANISKRNLFKIYLLHVVKRQEQIDEATKKIEAESNRLSQKYGVLKPTTFVQVGELRKTINRVAEEIEASVVIMGTHGIIGSQKILGSRAMKMIVGSQIPFIVVQSLPHNNNYSRVVMPMDFRREAREKVRWARFLSRYFESEIDIVYPTAKDVGLRTLINNTIAIAKKLLDSNEVSYNLVKLPDSHKFHEAYQLHAKSIDADLILINTKKGFNLFDMMFSPPEQYVLVNKEKIPVMIINPKPPIIDSGGFSATGG